MASLTMAAPPPPVALEEVKAFLRVQHSAEDALLAGFIRTASAACEAFTGLTLIERAADERVEATGTWRRLGLHPVRAIGGAAALGADGTETLIAPSDYAVDIDAAGDGWVRIARGAGLRSAKISFTAGMAADWNGVPEPLRQGIVRLAAHLYSARGEDQAAPPASVAALWRPWRRLRMT